MAGSTRVPPRRSRSRSPASDHPPAAQNDFPTVVQGSGPVRIYVLANDSDPDGDPLAIAGYRQGANGRVALSSDRTYLTYDPNGSFIGTDTFIYSVSDGRGGLAFGRVLVTVVKDTFAPVVTAPRPWLRTGYYSSWAPITLTWSGTDQGFGIRTYQIQQSRDNQPWAYVTLPLGARSLVRSVAIGSYYQYRVRAIDLAGNVGKWAYLAFTPRVTEETGATYLGTWTSATLANAYGGSVTYAGTHGSVASFTCTCSSLVWIGPKSATRGTARVYADGVLIGIYSEKSTTTLFRQGIATITFASKGTHRIDISVTGVGRVDVDAFVTLE